MGKYILPLKKIIAFPAILLFIFVFASTQSMAQGSVGIGDAAPDQSTSAILYLNSTAKGFLAPRVTLAEKTAIAPAASYAGLLVYQTDGDAGFWYWDGAQWVKNAPPFPALVAGDGLSGANYTSVATQTWAADYAGTGGDFGSATTLARSDHDHPGLLPDGTVDYQTLYWDDTGQVWIPSSTLSNDNTSVGIGGASDEATAILEIESTTSGLLIPRMTEAQRTSIVLPADGLLVYETDTNEGFWYYDSVLGWTQIGISGTDWMLAGNTGTNHANDYLGTGDAVDLVLRANATERMRISSGGDVDFSLNDYVSIDDGNQIRFEEPIASGANYTSFQAVAQADNITYTLPPADGNTGEALTTDGSGVLTWSPGATDGDWTVDGNDMYSAVSGNVGIGISSPGTKLDVNGAGSFSGDLFLQGNASPTTSAILNINSSNQGILIPDVSLTGDQDVISIDNGNTDGLLIYSSAGSLEKGFYWWNNTTSSWIGFQTSGESWLLTGNSGTDPSTNYLGTSDATDLVFRTSDTEQMRILSGGNVGIGTDNPGVLLDVNGAGSFSDDLTVTDGDILISNTNAAGSLSFQEPSGSGTNITSFSATVQSEDINYVWPAEQGASSTTSVLTNDGTGELEWMPSGRLITEVRYELTTVAAGYSTYTIQEDDSVIIYYRDTDVEGTLPSAASVGRGKIYYIRWGLTSKHVMTLYPQTGESIDGEDPSDPKVYPRNISGVLVISDGDDWYSIASYYEN